MSLSTEPARPTWISRCVQHLRGGSLPHPNRQRNGRTPPPPPPVTPVSTLVAKLATVRGLGHGSGLRPGTFYLVAFLAIAGVCCCLRAWCDFVCCSTCGAVCERAVDGLMARQASFVLIRLMMWL